MTAPAGHNSFRTFIERIERLEEERRTIADDIKEVYAEMKDEGFDKEAAKVVLKIRRADDGLAKWTVRSATVDQYLAHLGMLPDEALAQVHVHDAREGEEPEQGEPEEITPDASADKALSPEEPEKEITSEPSPPATPETTAAGTAEPPPSAVPAPSHDDLEIPDFLKRDDGYGSRTMEDA